MVRQATPDLGLTKPYPPTLTPLTRAQVSEGEAACCFTWKAVVSPVTPTPTLTLTPALTLEPQPLSRNPSSSRRPNPNPNPWKVVVNGQDGPQGLSFYEVNDKGQVCFVPSAGGARGPASARPQRCSGRSKRS